ncbi:MAG: ribokinase [Pirellulaceae bacterium]|nr:ribokinase [Pirellulaceae bacterium]
MPHRSRICVLGSANVDLTFRTPRFPQAGETLTGRSMHQGMGGKGANQAVAAARLGADVTLVACVGHDAFGAEAIGQYEMEGIQTEFIRRVANQPTGTAAIVVDDQAENFIIVIPGANAAMTPADVRNAAKAIERADVVVCQLETPVAVAIEAFRMAREVGKCTILTPSPMRRLPDDLLQLCDVCVPNRTEIEHLVGHTINTDQDAQQAAKLLMAKGVKAVALTMGSEGAYIVDHCESTQVPVMKVDAVDTTGAGDAFSAALAVWLGEGLSLHEAAQRASVVAALTVTRIGTQAAFPVRQEVDDLYRANSITQSANR